LLNCGGEVTASPVLGEFTVPTLTLRVRLGGYFSGVMHQDVVGFTRRFFIF